MEELMEPIIQIKNVTKTFIGKDNQVEALKGISLDINKGDIYGIIGMSGAGKSTLVRCLNYLEKPTTGTVVVEDQDLSTLTEAELRKVRTGIAMIFQHFNLLMQRSVLDNVCFPMEIVGVKKQAARKRAMELLEIVGLKEKADAYPSQLSGGQKQRTAMARMLAGEPEILMLDEPFTALDNYLKMQLERELMNVMEDYGKTVLFVSHDRNEAYRMTDRIAVMEDGKILDVQPKEELFQNPASLAATLLTGCKNVSMLQAESDSGYAATDWGICLSAPPREGSYKYAAFRAHYFQVVPAMEATNVLECHILRVIEDTFSTVVLFCNGNRTGEHASEVLTYELPKEEWQALKHAETLYLKMPPEQIIWLEK